MYRRLMGVDMVILRVGPPGPFCRTFTVHKDLLCARIEYFKGMFMNSFTESTHGVATLPADDPSALEMLLCWVYFDKLPYLVLPDQELKTTTHSKRWPESYA